MLKMRAFDHRHTAEMFDPDIFIVDRSRFGLRGEVLDTLEMLKQRGTRLVLGLRDVMDEPNSSCRSGGAKNVLPALRDLYDENMDIRFAADLRSAPKGLRSRRE